jgi:integrase/recombinase XerD
MEARYGVTFYALSREIGLRGPTASHGPRLHDFRYVLSLIMFLVFLPAFTSVFHLLP